MKRLIAIPVVAFFLGTVSFVIAEIANKVTVATAVQEAQSYIKEILAERKASLSQVQIDGFFNKATTELTSKKDARGFIAKKDVLFVKDQFKEYAEATFPRLANTTYYNAVKQLKEFTLEQHKKILGQSVPSARHALWRKLKREFIDKRLRISAYIEGDEIVVNDTVIKEIQEKILTRMQTLARAKHKKNDRIISIGYAESKVRSMIRKAGFRKPHDIDTLMRLIQTDVARSANDNRIELSKLESIVIATIQQYKRNKQAPTEKRLSYLAAEVMMLKAIKKAKLPNAKEIAVTTKMLDELSKIATKRRPTEKMVREIIQKHLSSTPQVDLNKRPTKKRKKRGKSYGRGRWGNHKRNGAERI